MRRLSAALLLSTALVHPAQADPVSALVAGLTATGSSLAVNLAVAQAVGGLGGTLFAVGAAVGAAASTLGGRLLLGLGVSALSASFAPSINLPTVRPSEQMGNFAQPISHAVTVYGRTRVGGPIGFTAAADSRRYYQIVMAAHEVAAFQQIWIDEWTIGLDGTVSAFTESNFLTSADSGAYTAPSVVGGNGRIETFNGAPGQAANAGLVSTFTEYTSAHDFEGLAGVVAWAQRVGSEDFSQVYPSGRQWSVTAVVDGKKVYDPRTATTAYSNNAALVIADWVVNTLGEQVDWADVAIEADVCDEIVTDRDGNDVPRWTINGTLQDNESYEAQRSQLAGACDAFFYERADGKVGFRVGRWIAPTVTLTDEDCIACTVSEGNWASGRPTEVAVIYVEPDNAYRERSAGVWVEDSTSKRVRDEPQLYLVTDHNQASRLAKRIAKSRRADKRLTATIGLMGYELIGQRFFRLTHAATGTDQTFEIARLTRTGLAQFEIEAVSVESTDFDFNAATEEPEKPTISTVDSAFVTPDVTGVTGSATSGGVVTVSWTAQPAYLWQEIRIREQGTTDWDATTITDGATSRTFTGLIAGMTYEFQVRNVQSGLLTSPSDWVPDPALAVAAVGDTVAPGDLIGLSVSEPGDPGDVVVSWTAPNSANYAGTRIWRGTDSTFGNATLIHTEFGAPSTADSYTDAGLSVDDYWYWAAPINGSGTQGNVSGPATITTT